MKPTLKPPKSQLLKLEHEKVLSNYPFKFNIRRYIPCIAPAAADGTRGRPVQVDPTIKTKLKPPGTKRLKLNYDILLSTSAF